MRIKYREYMSDIRKIRDWLIAQAFICIAILPKRGFIVLPDVTRFYKVYDGSRAVLPRNLS